MPIEASCIGHKRALLLDNYFLLRKIMFKASHHQSRDLASCAASLYGNWSRDESQRLSELFDTLSRAIALLFKAQWSKKSLNNWQHNFAYIFFASFDASSPPCVCTLGTLFTLCWMTTNTAADGTRQRERDGWAEVEEKLKLNWIKCKSQRNFFFLHFIARGGGGDLMEFELIDDSQHELAR